MDQYLLWPAVTILACKSPTGVQHQRAMSSATGLHINAFRYYWCTESSTRRQAEHSTDCTPRYSKTHSNSLLFFKQGSKQYRRGTNLTSGSSALFYIESYGTTTTIFENTLSDPSPKNTSQSKCLAYRARIQKLASSQQHTGTSDYTMRQGQRTMEALERTMNPLEYHRRRVPKGPRTRK